MGDDVNPPAAPRRIAIAGNPNSGKTTVFNALTGLRQKVANYPGVTVEKREGRLRGADVTLLDLPGIYSLTARSPDEEIARDILQGRMAGIPRPDAVLIVIDASNLERNLYLATQIIDFGVPVVIACNMIDVAKSRGLNIDIERLSAALGGVPVIPVVGHRGDGIPALRQALLNVDGHRSRLRTWKLPDPFETAIETIAAELHSAGALPAHIARPGTLLWLMDYLAGDDSSRASAERFLARLPNDRAAAIRRIADRLARECPDAAAAAIEARYEWISSIAAEVRRTRPDPTKTAPVTTPSDRIDRILTHRVWGMLIFAAIMFIVFLSIFSWAEPLMNLLDSGRIALSNIVISHMQDGPIRSLITDGVIAGVGAVVGFFPQICILFLCLAIMEESGYMARAAFLMDRLMSKVGLHGKSFIPLLSSYACAIPGIMATRTIENRRDRFTTIMIAPLMSCSARLPVYLIVIGAVFADRTLLKAEVMFSLYALGTITALVMALIFKKTLFAGPRPPFIMELPPYHLPQVAPLLRAMWDRSKLFLTNAGTTIFAVCIVIWALSYFPRITPERMSPDARTRLVQLEAHGDREAKENLIASERLRHSYIGHIGRFIEPAISPLGFDWRLGVGMLSSFLAREVFVGAMGITFAVGDPENHAEALRQQLSSATWPDGRRVLTTAAGLSLLVFYVLACQCASTLAVVKKETGTWLWPSVMFFYMTGLAYVGALLTYQVGTRFFHA
ncbi:MAG TPA: ferrous iron transport protein B [Phycisphaerae bacterium]|nr:ferrous iron transport protein B [Phycisphaerae bacterium]